MGLFGKKKLSLDEILEGINNLSEEEKAKALAAMHGNAEPKKEEVEEQVEDAGVETTEGEEVEGEQVESEAAEEVEEVEEPAETAVEPTPEEGEVEEAAEPQTEEADVTLAEGESATDEMANDNRDAIIHQLTDKVNELSEQIKGLLELKTLMEEYTGKQAESFGYKGNVLGAKKDYKDMSTEELKAHVMKGI